MNLSQGALLLALTNTPSKGSSWSLGPRYYSVVPTTTMQSHRMFDALDASFDRVLARQRRIAQRMFDQAAAMPPMSSNSQLVDNNDKIFQVTMDVPGIDKDNLSIGISDTDRTLTIRGERKDSNEEIIIGQFSRSFQLDPSVDLDKVTASLQNGVLTISAPKKDLKQLEEEKAVRKIPIISSQKKVESKTVEASEEPSAAVQETTDETMDLDDDDDDDNNNPEETK